ncbi:MAG: M23 family metallopeptidase [Bacteroidetes bacterium]|nr:MAG: M23 family metallopeptidase [Bacteroidota bacterium]
MINDSVVYQFFLNLYRFKNKGVGEKNKRGFLDKLKDQYRLTIFNDSTFQSVWSMKLSRLKVLGAFSMVSLIMIILVTFLIAATGLREYIPGYPDAEQRQLMVETALKVDSLEFELKKRDDFFQGIKAIISGEIPEDNIVYDTASESYEVNFEEYNHDSIFQDNLLAEQLNLSIQGSTRRSTELSQIHFYVPVKGIVTNHFNISTEHFGIDLVSDPNARISSVLEGTVIFSGWTLETGYVLYLQHDADLVSVYKHNAELLKSTGDRVRAGEAIAIIGNSGELTTGPHLHFELWHRGNAINPEQYIDF